MVRLFAANIAKTVGVAAAAFLVCAAIGDVAAQTASAPEARDPGPRGGAPSAGGPLPGLDQNELGFFAAARNRFQEIDSVTGELPEEAGIGLGPRFNMNSCSGCHAFPDVGGSSPPVNPQVAVATLDGAKNVIPSFIHPNGPVREARFVRNPDGTRDGGVHNLFVITGRSDAEGCAITQPDFAQQLEVGNLIFRIPTPVFGAGLVENVPDANLIAAQESLAPLRAALGISGHFNRSGNDGSITRFGWKAQNKSLLIFAGEAYNVEQGVTNDAFPNEREGDANCQFNATPEDGTNLTGAYNSGNPASDFASDIVNFAGFMRLLAPPTPAAPNPSATRGRQVFLDLGCQGCHIVQQTTALSPFTHQSEVTFEPFSDFAVHAMGRRLADGIAQGEAAGDEFRTAPLWGLGQRLFLLHDGRTRDLVEAIEAHASDGSEANTVVANYRLLSPARKQDLLNFLRSL